jgi:MoaA/NifB/PqqE/SkfB family radical SAM enzyme
VPSICNYYVTLRCNQLCTFCNIPHTNNGSPSREPTMEQVRENLRDLKKLGVMILDVTGGEPLLYRNLVEMLEYAKKLRLITSVTTNGMLYPKFAKQLLGKVDALLFSVDSTDPDEHDRIRAMKSFHLVLEALATARQLRQPMYISHVVTNDSYDNVEEMIRFAKDQRAILYLNPCFSFFGNEGLVADKAMGLMQYFGREGVIVDPAQLKLIASGGNDVRDPVCKAVSSTVVISPENKLMLPCYHFKDEELAIDGKLYELYTRSPLVEQAKKGEGKFNFCSGCTVYCYMRNSLFWRYPVDSALMLGHYVRERVRMQVKNTLSPAPHEIIQPAPVVRKRPSAAAASDVQPPLTPKPPKPSRMPNIPLPPLAALAEPADRRRLPLL